MNLEAASTRPLTGEAVSVPMGVVAWRVSRWVRFRSPLAWGDLEASTCRPSVTLRHDA